MNLSVVARTPGKISRINKTAANVPCEIVSHILAAMADAKLATTRVTIINIEEELMIV